MHLTLVGISAILLFPTLVMIGIGLYKEKQWKSFRAYTFISIIILFIFGGLSAFVIMNSIEIIGLVERISIYTFHIWSVVLALCLIKEN